MTYKLPQGLTCDGQTTRCVLQWYYLTGALLELRGHSVVPGMLWGTPCGGKTVVAIAVDLPPRAAPCRQYM